MPRPLDTGALLVAFCAAMAPAAWAGEGPTEPGRFEVELLTIEPGDDMITAGGHSALRVVDRETGDDWVYNWGLLEWSEDLYVRLVAGPTNYMLGVEPFGEALAIYREENRTVIGQGLDLAPEDALRLVAEVQVSSQPENREYLYHHFDDNCSTRVRDVIDRHAHGAIRRASVGSSGLTFREHSYQRGAPSIPVVLLLDLIANGRWERTATVREAHFLPSNLYESVRRARLGDRPLVYEERIYHQRRGAPPGHVSIRPGWYLLGGPVLFLLVALLLRRRSARGPAVVRAGLGLVAALLGLGGLVVFAAWFFTTHPDFDDNAMLFFLWPTDLVLVALASPTLWNGRPRRLAAGYLALRLAAAAVGVVVVLAWAYQDVWSIAIPAAAGLALALAATIATPASGPGKAGP